MFQLQSFRAWNALSWFHKQWVFRLVWKPSRTHSAPELSCLVAQNRGFPQKGKEERISIAFLGWKRTVGKCDPYPFPPNLMCNSPSPSTAHFSCSSQRGGTKKTTWSGVPCGGLGARELSSYWPLESLTWQVMEGPPPCLLSTYYFPLVFLGLLCISFLSKK